MTRRTLGGLALLTLAGFGCQSAEERQAQELRQALLEIDDDVEELQREEIAVLEQLKEIVATLPAPNIFKGQGWPSTADVEREIQNSEKQLKAAKAAKPQGDAQ